MSMKRLIDLADAKAKEDMKEYYIIDKGRLDNIISCFESGAKRIGELTKTIETQQEEINQLTKQLLEVYC